jgi:hypothetical protein
MYIFTDALVFNLCVETGAIDKNIFTKDYW